MSNVVHFECELPYRKEVSGTVACNIWDPSKYKKTTVIEDVTCGQCLRTKVMFEIAEKQGKVKCVPNEPPEGFGGAIDVGAKTEASSRLVGLEAENARLRHALNDLLNDCINFDGGKLSDCKMKQAAEVLGECDLTKPKN